MFTTTENGDVASIPTQRVTALKDASGQTALSVTNRQLLDPDGEVALDFNNAAVLRWQLSSGNAAGSNQGNATALVEGVNIIGGADGTKGVILPAIPIGGTATVVVVNTSSSNLNVYPTVGASINALSTNAALAIAQGVSTFYSGGAGSSRWWK